MLDKDSEMRNVFLGELKDILDKINNNLKTLEDDSVNSKSIDSIFQSIHTLKGMFASIEFQSAAEACHIAEDALVQLKKIKYVDSDTLDIFYEFHDKFENVLEVFNSYDSVNQDLESLFESFEFNLLIKNLTSISSQSGINLGSKLSIVVNFDQECKLKGARAFQVLTTLENVAKIIEANPSRQQIEEGDSFVNLKVVIITQEEETSIKKLIEDVDEVSTVQIETLFDERATDEQGTKSVGKGLQSIRVQLSLIDQLMDLLGELVIERNALSQQLIDLGVNSSLFTQMDRTIEDLRRLILKTRLVPLEYIFDNIPRIVRDATKNTDKKVNSIISGKYVEIDRTSVEYLNEAILHLIRNAIFHGIEPPSERKKKGKKEEAIVQINARIDRNDIVITVEDDGRGIDVKSVRKKAIEDGLITETQKIDREGLIALLFLSGFTTSENVTSVAGRGVGLNIVHQNIVEKLNGNINAESKKDKGTRFTIRIPTQISIMDALVVKIGSNQFTVPLSNVLHIYKLSEEKIYYHNGKPNVVINREIIPVVSLRDKFKIEEKGVTDNYNTLIIWEQAGKKLGVIVDQIVTQLQIVQKTADRLIQSVKGFSGFTLIGEGNVVPILDPTAFLKTNT